MALYISSLNSGSNGNCYYIGNETEAVLIDAGISCKEIEKRMHKLGLPMSRIKAVFISHEHSDHIRGLEMLCKKHQFPVYITALTLLSGRLRICEDLLRTFDARQTVRIGGLEIVAFKKQHDACDPHSFVVRSNGINVGIFTDIGIACDEVIRHFKTCHAAFLESNYDEVMLENGRYPYHLKKRIRGGRGHLSNSEALAIFKAHRPPFMTHIFLSHLSAQNNSPHIAEALFKPHAGKVKVMVASRQEAMELCLIQGGQQHITPSPAVMQMSFAFA